MSKALEEARRKIHEELMSEVIPGCSRKPDEEIGKHLVHTMEWLIESIVQTRLACRWIPVEEGFPPISHISGLHVDYSNRVEVLDDSAGIWIGLAWFTKKGDFSHWQILTPNGPCPPVLPITHWRELRP